MVYYLLSNLQITKSAIWTSLFIILSMPSVTEKEKNNKIRLTSCALCANLA